jgi:hypothetical protein
MATCCIPNCPNELSGHARLRTCNNCRAYLHRWDRRRPAEILDYSQRLALYRSRMASFVDVKDDEVNKRSHAELEKQGLALFPTRAKRRAKAIVVDLKVRERTRKRA